MKESIDTNKIISDYIKKQRNGGRAAPPEYKMFWFDHDEVWTDEVVNEYYKVFNIEKENVRLTDLEGEF